MSLFITSLNSGSNGNCYYVGNNNEAVFVDVGISCKEVELRMKRLDLSLDKIKAIFISHEHGDHIKGVQTLSKKYNLPVYITPQTLSHSHLVLENVLIKSFNGYEKVVIGNLVITPFPKRHDASDPYSFIVEGNGIKIGVLTDIGSACQHVIENFKQCHAAFLEANYDEGLLDSGYYPYYLKERIRSDKGHLSNKQALDLFVNHKSELMSHVILSHLSKDNNCPIVVKDLFTKHAQQTQVVVASRLQETEVFHITGSFVSENVMKPKVTFQTSLF
ncbi:MAG: MBL fold metallo-hydrolase [Sphingobacteriaceae bacterium]|nr:MBL fold metallo-hydrolase [Sphingobacteriaceae bacterium]